MHNRRARPRSLQTDKTIDTAHFGAYFGNVNMSMFVCLCSCPDWRHQVLQCIDFYATISNKKQPTPHRSAKSQSFFRLPKQVYCFPALNDGTAFPPFFSLYLQHQWEMFQVCSFHLTQLYQKTDSTRQSYNSTLISLLHSSRARSYTYQTNSLAMQQIY